jgi:outer membrane protein OmpA-like peptidoglycan-associated protein
MTLSRRTFTVTAATFLASPWISKIDPAAAQEGMGPFMPHEGLMITTAWGNAYGPDAESWMKFSKVGKETADIDYSSSRGMTAHRRLRAVDRQNGRTLVLGYNSAMPLIIQNTTTIGVSSAVLEELRSTGQASLGLIPDTSMSVMQGQLRVAEKIKMQVDVGGHQVPVPVIHATAQFSNGSKQATGDLYILENRNNPMLIEYSLSFKGEKAPRHERVVLVTPGAGMQSEMEQALATVREYITRGIHFDFDKATIRSTSNGLLSDIAKTLTNNPLWTLQIAGHTDSIGEPAYNKKLSLRRAQSVKAALEKRGISGDRLTTTGAGASAPVASNKTLEGRAQNRRVVLTRTDR